MAYEQPEEEHHNVRGLIITKRMVPNGVEISWINSLASEYPLLRGFRKEGGVDGIQDKKYLVHDTRVQSGRWTDPIPRGIPFSYYFRLYCPVSLRLSDFNIGNPERKKRLKEELDRVREAREAEWEEAERRGSWWSRLFGGSKEETKISEAMPQGYDPREIYERRGSSEDSSSGAAFVALLLKAALAQRGKENASVVAQIINNLIPDEELDPITGGGAPHWITFSAFLPGVNSTTEKAEDTIRRNEAMAKLITKKLRENEEQRLQEIQNIKKLNLDPRDEAVQIQVIDKMYATLAQRIRSML